MLTQFVSCIQGCFSSPNDLYDNTENLLKTINSHREIRVSDRIRIKRVPSQYISRTKLEKSDELETGKTSMTKKVSFSFDLKIGKDRSLFYKYVVVS